MAALTADLHMDSVGNPVKVALNSGVADTYFKGAMVFALAAGSITPVAAASLPFLGIVAEQVVAAIGDEVDVFIDGYFWMAFVTPAVGNEGEVLCMAADGTLSDNVADATPVSDITPVLAGDILIGKIIRVNGTTNGLVHLHETVGIATAVTVLNFGHAG